ncbi:MAG: hypothetical protein JWM16_2313 [Verrucomicrobiales bacterium]|nr:hypothetical protein [Verrucomicrobiales bacterium]
MPPNAEVVGLLSGSNPARYKQVGIDSVVKKLKTEAGKIGANGIVVTKQDNDGWTGAKVSGTAIFVPNL